MVIHKALGLLLLFLTCTNAEYLVGHSWIETPECFSIDRTMLPTERLVLLSEGYELVVDVEVARTTEARFQGLQCRMEIPNKTGMLFEFPSDVNTGFWMFNTYVPLDLIYFNKSGVAVAASTLQPCPRLLSEQETVWRNRCVEATLPFIPKYSYRYVLETTAGWLQTEGVFMDSIRGNLQMRRDKPSYPIEKEI